MTEIKGIDVSKWQGEIDWQAVKDSGVRFAILRAGYGQGVLDPTFAENAMLKAKAVCAASGLPAIADDSGLCVDALNGGPGVYSARYGGEGLDDIGRYRLLLNNLRGATTRAAHFACAIACAFPNGDELTAEGRCDGAIAFAPMGEGGFGYDPVFLVPEMRKTFSQMTADEKSGISHRGRAMEKFVEKLETYLAK